jgi:hypothetical protein
MLDDELWQANGHYVSLILQQDRVSGSVKEKAGRMEALAIEAAIERAENVRASASHDLTAHRAAHAAGQRAMTRTAVLVFPADREAARRSHL